MSEWLKNTKLSLLKLEKHPRKMEQRMTQKMFLLLKERIGLRMGNETFYRDAQSKIEAIKD